MVTVPKIAVYILFLTFNLGVYKNGHSANSGSATISLSIPAVVQISGLSDITLTPSSFTAAITGNTTTCIYSNNTTPLGTYVLTATSANALSGAFRVIKGTSYITYSAFWNSNSAATQTLALTSGSTTGQLSGASSTSLNCGGSKNANFNISFALNQLLGANPGTYTDTVTLLIAPA